MYPRNSDLTSRELEIIALIAKGRTDDEIAAIEQRSTHTIKSQIKMIRQKLSASNKAHVVAIAYDLGILP